ncbi:MAG TPA: 2'-5' RNA ligase family protein [Chitinophaga sp.]|uniref:2'-5' RNA ligase family protein n=1 Tax=Chitinophaga sp. TaxID=1869181 RepID=UPI002C657D08|nr:2'-5' RNA ligase family protein [Chitinophaga sp.]HVI48636.1 2'-5' RNA ligase family protein [Chitinophaga sp.]
MNNISYSCRNNMQRKSLIITVDIDEEHQQFFNQMRKQHFPAHANYLDAHITLFYKLPSDEGAIHEALKRFAAREPIALTVEGLVNFGTGVAYTIISDELAQLHTDMQVAFDAWLIRQDRKPFRPHITIQNKVTAFKAQQLHTQLQKDFQPFVVMATGIRTWQYLGGPWKEIEGIAFSY